MAPLQVWLLIGLVSLSLATPMQSNRYVMTEDEKSGTSKEADSIRVYENKEAKKEAESTLPRWNRITSGRRLVPAMQMLDPKRYPKPKRPLGNDIGVARVLDTYSHPIPTGLSSPARAPDHLEAMVSIGYTMSAANATQPSRKDDEYTVISREMQQFLAQMPKIPKLYIPNIEFHKDPEEEAINQRITEVARQLAEDTMRKQYEAETNEQTKEVTTTTKTSTEAKATQPTEDTTQTLLVNKEKKGKSFLTSNTLPLVSHLPPEAAQLQLIAEVQPVPQFMLREGFRPMTPPPELIGPLLGGPPLKEDGTPDLTERRGGRKSSELPNPARATSVYISVPITFVPEERLLDQNAPVTGNTQLIFSKQATS